MFQTSSVAQTLPAKPQPILQWLLVRLAICLLLTLLDFTVVAYFGESLLQVAVHNTFFLLLLAGILLGLVVSLARVWLFMFHRH